MLKLVITFTLAILSLPATTWADFEDGLHAYLRDDYATALKEWQPLAKAGHPRAQFGLSVLYAEGIGVPQNYEQARWWSEKAAAQGHPRAQTHLGILYFNGHGGPKDYEKALVWFQLAANQGDALGQLNLGVMYERGNGIPQNFIEAYKWYNLAAASGESDAAELRDNLARQMTPAQIAEAQRLEPISKLKSAILSRIQHERAKALTPIFPRILGVAHAWRP